MDWRRRLLRDGPEAVVCSLEGPSRRRVSRFHALWIALVLHRVTSLSPTGFCFVRSCWTCGTVAFLLADQRGVLVSRKTVRR